MILSLASLALAHLPHDNAGGLAAPASLSGELPWYLVGESTHVPLIYRSDDGGLSWEMVGGAPTQSDLIDAAALDDGAALLLAVEGFWLKAAEQDWVFHTLSGGARAVDSDGSVFRIATADGVVEVVADGTQTREQGGLDVMTMVHSEFGWAAVEFEAGVWLDAGAGWISLGSPAPELDISTAVAGPGVVYAGTIDAQVFKFLGDWSACGAFPQGPAEGFTDIVRMDFTHTDTLLVGTAWRGPIISDDGCGSFTDGLASPLDTIYEGSGSASDPSEGAAALKAKGDTWVHSGWNGFAVSQDGGVEWSVASLVPLDAGRAIRFDADFLKNGRVYIATENGGVVRGLEGGADFDAPNIGHDSPNVAYIATAPELVIAVTAHGTMLSRDGGVTWQQAALPFDSTFRVEIDGENIWAFSGQLIDEVPELVLSQDFGESWSPVTVGDAGPRLWSGVEEHDEGICLVSKDLPQVWCSPDGVDWTRRWVGLSDQASDIVQVEGRMLFFVDTQVIASEDGGETWDVLVELGRELLNATLAGEWLFAAGRDGSIWRSHDAGESWTDLGVFLPALVYDIAPRPDFDSGADTLLINTAAGPFAVHEALSDARIEDFAAYIVLDDASGFFDCVESCPSQSTGDDYALETVSELVEGSGLSVSGPGTAVRLLGEGDGGCTVEVRVDGDVVGELGADPAELGLLAEIEGLGEGRHRLEIVATEGSCVRLDSVHLFGAAEALEYGVEDSGESGLDSDVSPTDGGGEGCGSGCGAPVAPLGLAPFALLLLFSRRRE